MTARSSTSPSSFREQLDALKLERLRGLVQAILPHNRFYASKLARVSHELPSLTAL
jgi:hypothetical protein